MEQRRINVGFPVVKNGQPYAVYVDTARNSRGLEWNATALDSSTPFGESSPLNDVFVSLAKHRRIRFHCRGLDAEHNQVKISENSFRAFAQLLSEFDLTYGEPEADLRVLLSGDYTNERGFVRLSKEDLNSKGVLAKANNTVLLLCADDYNQLTASTGYFTAIADDYYVPVTIEKILEIKKRAVDIPVALALPTIRSGWDIENGGWAKQLGTYLGLGRWAPPSSDTSVWSRALAPRSETQPPEEGSQTNEELLVSAGTIGELYACALPKENEFLQKLLRKHSDEFALPMFQDGVAMKAVRFKEQVFVSTEETPSPNILISGPTGCGKTFLAEALMLNTVLEQRGRVLYIAPIRELAEERFAELRRRFLNIDDRTFNIDNIVLSTGEVNEDDWKIQSGDFNIALMVNEKANIFLRPSQAMLGHLNLIVIDELHMLSHPTRGGVIDLLIAKAQFERERRRDIESDPNGLRLVGISTDMLGRQEDLNRALEFVDRSDFVHKPLLLSTDNRPIPVSHRVEVYGSKAEAREATEITNFDCEENLHLDDVRFETVRREVFASLAKVESPDLPAVYDSRAYKQSAFLPNLLEVIDEYSKNHRSLLVVVNSVKDGQRLAKMLLEKRRGEPISDGEALQLHTKGIISKSKATDLKEFAEKGIYLHNSELPRLVRQSISSHFRTRLQPVPGITSILIATETLSYGVNLNTDCVIIANLEFARSYMRSGNREGMDLLTQNEFHNIMGRAGRFSRWGGQSATAVFCVPGNVNQYGFRQRFAQYYHRGSQLPLKSTLLSESDKTSVDKGQTSRLDQVSFETFRSVLEALRYTTDGGYSTVQRVRSMFADTVYGKAIRADDKNAWDRIRNVIVTVLNLCQAEGLVEAGKFEAEFKVLPKAEALIDTGTSYSAVQPMAEWLTAVSKFSETVGGALPNDDLPIEVLIPAIVAAPNYWSVAVEFCEESRVRQQPQAITAIENEEYCRSLVRDEFKKLGLTDPVSGALEAELFSFASSATKEFRLTAADNCKVAALYRLVVSLLQWIRGETPEQIQLLSQMGVNEDNMRSKENQARDYPFKERYRERARWLAIACGRFFEKDNTLIPSHRRKMRIFSERLAHGVPEVGLPLAGADLGRDAIKLLLSTGITPSKILAEDPFAVSFQWNGIEGNFSFLEVLDDVKLYYLKQIDALLGTLDLKKEWSAISTIKGIFANYLKFGVSVQRDELRRVLTEWAKESSSESMEFRTDDGILVLYQKGTDDRNLQTRFLLREATDKSEVDANVDFIVRLPWWRTDIVSGKPELSLVAFVTLMCLVTRNFVRVGPFLEWKKSLSLERVGVREIAEIDMGELIEDIRDSLDRFDEPGL